MPVTIPFPEFYLTKYEDVSLEELIAEFRILDAVLDNQEFETRKLMILQRVEQQLQQQMRYPIIHVVEVSHEVNDYRRLLCKFTYQFCMTFGFFEKAAGSFLFGSTLFALIPGIGSFSLYALTTIYTLLDAMLFYAFEVTLLRKSFGIIFSNQGACLLNETYAQQLKTTLAINLILDNRETVDWHLDTYLTYCEAIKIFNGHLLRKHNCMGDYMRSQSRIYLEYGVVMFGGLSSIADSYFMAKNALLALHISFLSSPIVCVLVVAMVVSSLVFYYAMGAKSMSKLVNPDRKSFYALKNNLTLFQQKFENRQPYMPHNLLQQLRRIV